MKRLLAILVLAAVLLAKEEGALFPMLVETGSVKQMSMNGGLSTMPARANGAHLNPAALFLYHHRYGKRVGLGGSFVNKKNGRMLAGGAVSYALTPMGVVGGEYLLRNSREGDAPFIHRGALTYSGLINQEDNGSVLSWGINATYLGNVGKYPAGKDTRVYAGDSTFYYESSTTSPYEGYNHAVMADIGFTEHDASRGLTYSVVFENIIGYNWLQRDNSYGSYTGTDSVDIDSTQMSIDTSRYTGAEWEDHGMLSGHHKSLLIGFAVQRTVGGGNVILTIPMDVRFWGLFDKELRNSSKWRNRCMMRTGAEANIAGKLAVRFGYAWASEEYYTLESGLPRFNNTHLLSGGLGLTLFEVFTVEAGFEKDGFAVGGSLYF